MKLLTLAEAAQFLRKSKSWLYQNRTIPRYRPERSRRVLYDEEDLIAWVKRGRVEPTQDKSLADSTQDATLRVAISDGLLYHRNARYR